MTPIRLISGFLTVGLWTLLSRVFGFVRDVAIAAYLGAGPVAEAFLIAFSLPNMFRRFFAEGAFNMAFVPIFAKKLENDEDALAFARNAASWLGMFLFAFSALAHLAMPWLVMAMAYGFRGDERFDMAVAYGRIAFPYILLISLTALLSGVLNSIGRFAVAAAAPTLLNVTFIVALVLADLRGWPMGAALAWAVPVAGLAQLLVLWWAAARAGFVIAPQWPRVSPEMKRLLRVMGPAILAGGVVQINLLVGRQVASFFDGAVAWLSYADRLYQLPLGVVGIAIGVVLLPELSRRLGREDTEGGRWSFSRALEFSLALTFPAAVALVVIAGPIVSVLFERGAFGPEDTAATAFALAVYGAGLPAFVLHKVLQPLYFARHDTRRPFNYAVVAMVVNAVLAVGLAPLIGYIAAALATSAAAWVMVWQLWRGARPLGRAAEPDDRFRQRLWRQVAAAALMGMALWLAALALAPWLATSGLRYAALAALVAFGGAVYFAAGAALGAFALSDFRSALRRRSAE